MPDDSRFEKNAFTLHRVAIRSPRPFAEVVERLEARAGHLDPDARPDRDDPDIETLRRRLADTAEPNGFVLLGKIDHQLLERLGRHGRSIQYAIGNPLVAADITSAHIGVGLYAPFRLGVFEDRASGGSTIMFDDPADLMGSFGDEHVAEVGRELSRKVHALAIDCV